ncbi:MAG: alpha-glucan family phosphorylase [Phycisphaerales bacterium]|nr:alpha-glucan family phosphorylase [Phycisphaerales bacterium]
MLPAGQANVRSFRVVPSVPEALQPLLEIAHNLWWTWHPEAVDLFIRLDRDLWESTGHNPVKMLGQVDQELLERVARDQSYLHALALVHARFTDHAQRASWFERQYPTVCEGNGGLPLRVAYFSAEFGLTECFQIYSGGLGGLAGDHLKSASELGIPLCAVGLLYRNGYFHQYLNADGYQQETYPDLDFPNQPIRRLIDPETGEQYRVHVELPDRDVTIGVWQAMVGRVPLYLLDTNFPENSRADRDITRTLYGGDIETRIQQEIVLGIGGIRALEKIGEKPTVCHINEGHAAFLCLERIARLREQHGVGFEEAKEAAAAGNLFTTHTPVPAGIDRFAPDLLERYLGRFIGRLGVDRDGLLALGRANPFDKNEFFSMAVLALRCAQFCNGVSKLHGAVSRNMWQHIWPGLPEGEVPIGHVTNGVHPRTWIHKGLVELYDRYVDPEWQLDPTDHHTWLAVYDIPDEELWAFRNEQRRSLIAWCRSRLRKQLIARGAPAEQIDRATGALDPNTFTIGFARRFATYKRGTLLMRDLERLKALLNNTNRPVQVLIAGKAHPADGPGKSLIRDIVKLSETSDFRHIVFLEDYDIEVARRMTQGCDIWLNTPKRGMEASGTSGMKAALNGVINCSILDGWWDEAYEARRGFAIGRGESYEDQNLADDVESKALYDLLERQILPEFYDRTEDNMPKAWLTRIKHNLRHFTPQYSTNRMVAEYAENYYLMAHGLSGSLQANELDQARQLAEQLRRYRRQWPGIKVRNITTDVRGSVPVRTPVHVQAEVDLGGLQPKELRVQLYAGEVTSLGDLVDASPLDMTHVEALSSGAHLFRAEYLPGGSGRRGYAVRVMPRDERLLGTLIPGLIAWDQDAPTHINANLSHERGATQTQQHQAAGPAPAPSHP